MHTTRALLSGIVDYAGLFPPAALDLDTASRNYDTYLSGEHAWMLGRFICPATRLAELQACMRTECNWNISALVDATDLDEQLRLVQDFNSEHIRRSTVDTLEIKVNSACDVDALALIPRDFTVYCEVPLNDSLGTSLHAVASAGLRAKIRSGGLNAAAFPPAEELARFIIGCDTARVPFKATAGLHHPIRCNAPFTYEKDSTRGTMHGFLNVFLAAALFRHAPEGAPLSRDELIAILDTDSPSEFRFDDNEVTWQDRRVSSDQLAETRANFAHSFGSCSFDEPINELRTLRLL